LKTIGFSAFILGFLLTTAFVGFVSPVIATGTIYIRSDGSVDPATTPIECVGNVYSFTENICDEIVVERDNIVVDGAGYILQGPGSGTGIDLSLRTNVTIRDMEIKEFLYGIYLYSSLNNNLSENNVINNNYGIRLCYSPKNSVSRNNIKNSFYGIWLSGSSNNTISENNITSNNHDGIWLSGSSDYNNVYGNNIKNNGYGMRLDDYSNSILRNNDVSNNEYNFGVYGSLLSEFIQDIDNSNTVNGKPIYYWVNRQDMAVPLDAGWIALINCTRITVKNLSLANNGQGMLLAYTRNSTITKNNITNNIHGLYLSGSSNNTINENNITANSGNGIYLYYSSNNTFSRNNFTNNSNQVYKVGDSINVWDNGIEGNYWSDYEDRYPNAIELNGSGIWDTPYVIDGKNQDNYPVVPEFPTWPSTWLILVVLIFPLAIYKRRLLEKPTR
jgi:parallel beta-helix repeat protein